MHVNLLNEIKAMLRTKLPVLVQVLLAARLVHLPGFSCLLPHDWLDSRHPYLKLLRFRL